MDERELLQYMVDKKKAIRQLEVYPREFDFKSTKNFIISLIGPRRAGKTYCMYNYILNEKQLSEREYIFIDFEDAAMTEAKFKDILKAVDIHEENYGQKPRYLFLDEIQNIENWSRAVRTLFESKQYYIFISRSSSKLLSKEIATSLRGRALTTTIMPLSFREYLKRKKLNLDKKTYSTSEKNNIKKHLRKYLKKGGFPDIVIEEEFADKFFNEYIDLVVFRDLVERYNIQNIFAVKYLIKEMLSSFSKEFSVNKAYNTLRSQNVGVSKKSLYNYLSYLQDAFFSFSLKKFYYSVKKSELSVPKIYLNDLGLINSQSMNFSENIGKLMENCVFLELFRGKVRSQELEIYYWKKQGEVDFVVKKGKSIEKLIQVSYDLSNETKEREVKSLIKASDELECKDIIVLTWRYEGTEMIKNKKVEFLPLWKWLINPIEI